jgi:hypothetical protein
MWWTPEEIRKSYFDEEATPIEYPGIDGTCLEDDFADEDEARENQLFLHLSLDGWSCEPIYRYEQPRHDGPNYTRGLLWFSPLHLAVVLVLTNNSIYLFVCDQLQDFEKRLAQIRLAFGPSMLNKARWV